MDKPNTSADVEAFLRGFSEDTFANNYPGVTARFADTFLAGGPDGAQPIRSSDFAMALPRRKQLFEQFACRCTELVSIRQNPLDARFVLARTEWRMQLTPPAALVDEFIVESSFLIDTGVTPFRILAYLAHQDIFALLRQRTSLPAR